jgi:hypothetical protein
MAMDETARFTRALSACLLAGLLLAGCSSEPVVEKSIEASPTQEAVVLPENLALRACALYDYSNSSYYLDAYELLIEDMCKQTELNEAVLDVRMGENIQGAPVGFFLDPIVFHLSYFDTFTPGGVTPIPIVVINEFDKDFWREQLEKLVTVDFEWYGLSDAGGHCGYRYEAEGFCHNIYIPKETVSGGSVLTLYLGTEAATRPMDTWRKSISTHAAVHAVQYQKKMTHYTQWAIEGQALLHELVAQQLLTGTNVRFEKYIEMPMTNDQRKFDPSSEDSIRAHIKACRKDGGQCLDFNSFAGSLYLEKLIADYGVEKYKQYFAKIWMNDEMGLPIGEYENEYAPRVFEEVYGFDLASWVDKEGVPYLYSVYQDAGY